MKTKLFSIFALLMLFAASISINSCSKEEEKGCTNCLNGGVFVNDQCNCPEGYTDSICSTQVTPKKIRISTITIRDFPAYNGSGYWDSGDYYGRRPDIYFKIVKDDVPIFNMLSFHDAYDNAVNSNDMLIMITYFDITDFNSQYSIELWDKDDNYENDELMLSLNFIPYSSTGGFPSTLYVEGPWGNVIFELEVLYVW